MSENKTTEVGLQNLPWDAIAGHQNQKAVLERAAREQKTHHALLFSGLAGVGKKAIAKAYAKALNCEERPKDDWQPACGTCRSCQLFEREAQPDYLEVHPNGRFIRVDQVRSIIKYCRTGPYDSRYKIVLIESVDSMNRESANALLKTLEEPQPNVLLFLITERPDSLLETIISRCQHLRFGAMNLDDVAKIAFKALGEKGTDGAAAKSAAAGATDGGELPKMTVEVASKLAAGSPGRAIEILESGILGQRDELFKAVVNLNKDETAVRFKLTESMIKGGRKELEPRLDLLRSFFRDLSIYGATKDANRLIHKDFLESVPDGIAWMPSLSAAKCAEQINQSLLLIDQNVNPQLVVENLLEFIGRHNQI